MEVGEERAVGTLNDVGDARRRRIDPEHVGRAFVPGPRPDRSAGRPIGQEAAKGLCDVAGERLLGGPAILRGRRAQIDVGGLSVELERFRDQRRQLASPEPRSERRGRTG
jgi:hypothetical protein